MAREIDVGWKVLHDSELWNAFSALAKGFKASVDNGKYVWVAGAGESGEAQFEVDRSILDELQAVGLVNETYELTPKGNQVRQTLQAASPESAEDEFLREFRKLHAFAEAPKARDVTAWANGLGPVQSRPSSAEGAA